MPLPPGQRGLRCPLATGEPPACALPAGVLDLAALQREPGRPGEVQGVQRGGGTGFWRFETIDGLWMAASFSADCRFTGGALLPDPACDANSDGLD